MRTTSDINPDNPIAGRYATTQSIRDNFAAAKDEIVDLQTEVADLRRTVEELEGTGIGGIGARVITVPRGNGYDMYANNFIGYMKIELIGDCRVTVGSSVYGPSFDVYSVHHTVMVQNVHSSSTPGWAFCWEPNVNWSRSRDQRLYVYANPGEILTPLYIACWPLAEGAGSSS